MYSLKLSLSLCVFSLLGLVGCAGFSGASFPDASTNPSQIPLGTIQGSDYGGHAPLVGAHVYVLQPSVGPAGTSPSSSNPISESNSYAGLASSLLTANYSSNGANYPATIQNVNDPNVPTSWYYLQTDLTGAFNITGDYTCTAGLPVYLYIYGGSPSFPSRSNTFNVSSVTVSGTANPYTVTFTTTTEENAYIGELVTFSGFTGSLAGLNGSAQTVTSTTLTTTTFSIATAAGTDGTTNFTGSYPTATFTPTFNPGVVNLAVLGNCPNNGSGQGAFTGANAISYVFVNEVSTAAAAYAFSPFTFSSSSTYNNALQIGTSPNNIAGIQNAAIIAKQLYDITGSQLSTSFAGEGHIANSTTAAGNGIVPQANLDTIGNILAACVDSNNSYIPANANNSNTASGSLSPQCSTLFTNATNTGIPTTSTQTGANAPGLAPPDTATAALNLARHPAGPPNSYSSTGSSTFVSALYGLPAGNRPFEPDLASSGSATPNDFTIAIDYPYSASVPNNSHSPRPESLAIDKIGNVWITSQAGSDGVYHFFEFSPTGIASNDYTQSSYIYGYVTIDSGETPWAGGASTNASPRYISATSTPADASGSVPVSYTYAAGATNATNSEYFRYASASDASGNVYFGNEKTSGSGVDYLETYAGAATKPTVTGTTAATAIATVSSDVSGFSHAAMDAAGDVYFDYNASNGAGTPYVTRVVASTGANASGWPISNATTNCTSLLDPESMAVTRIGDVIVSDYHNQSGTLNDANSNLYYITSGGTCTQLAGTSLLAGLNSPFGAVIDGNNYFFTTNRGGSTISEFNAGTSAATVTSVSPSTGLEPQYYPSGSSTLTNMLANPLNIAAGPSGELWITDFGNGALVEIIGLAHPTTTPLSVAATPVSNFGGSIGYRP
jgi:hypothetical protein